MLIIGVLRHLAAIVVLPFTVTVVVPLWLLRRSHTAIGLGSTPADLAVQGGGIAVLSVGLLLFAASLRRFAVQGQGTLAPWDPPRRLVVSGPYRFVRNPMIAGVIFILIGEALVLRSTPHAWWAAVFALINVVYFMAFEEPQLERRFGDSYREYKRHVRRIVPRLRPWDP